MTNDYEGNFTGTWCGLKPNNTINNSHLPDLTDRLINCHNLLQLAREYLMPMAIDNKAFNHACDNILDAMGDIELAIAKLQQP